MTQNPSSAIVKAITQGTIVDGAPEVLILIEGPKGGQIGAASLSIESARQLAADILASIDGRCINEASLMLTMSTAHVDKATIECLELQTDDVPPSYLKGDYGWFVSVPFATYDGPATVASHDPATCPEDLRGVLAYARARGYRWICLDRDGDLIDTLPQYKW
jgi:hypothetical protein